MVLSDASQNPSWLDPFYERLNDHRTQGSVQAVCPNITDPELAQELVDEGYCGSITEALEMIKVYRAVGNGLPFIA